MFKIKFWGLLAMIANKPVGWVNDITMYCMTRDYSEFMMNMSSYNAYEDRFEHPFSKLYYAALMTWWYFHRKMLKAHREWRESKIWNQH